MSRSPGIAPLQDVLWRPTTAAAALDYVMEQAPGLLQRCVADLLLDAACVMRCGDDVPCSLQSAACIAPQHAKPSTPSLSAAGFSNAKKCLEPQLEPTFVSEHPAAESSSPSALRCSPGTLARTAPRSWQPGRCWTSALRPAWRSSARGWRWRWSCSALCWTPARARCVHKTG